MENKQNTRKGKAWAWVAGILAFLLVAGYAGWYYFKKDLANPQSKIAKPLSISY
jgi:hypothetical protein